MKQENQKPSEDVRVQITTRLWGMAVGMLGISIPLSEITHSALIPLAVIVGAAVSTAAIWRSGARNTSSQSNAPIFSNDAAQKRIAELEERVANLETINNFERRLAEESLKRHESNHSILIGEIAKDTPTEATTTTSRIAA